MSVLSIRKEEKKKKYEEEEINKLLDCLSALSKKKEGKNKKERKGKKKRGIGKQEVSP